MNAAKAGFPAMRFRDLAGVVAITLAVLMASLPRTRAEGGGDRTILFVCQHGVVNSQMAASMGRFLLSGPYGCKRNSGSFQTISTV